MKILYISYFHKKTKYNNLAIFLSLFLITINIIDTQIVIIVIILLDIILFKYNIISKG